ncbi:hypothetical protein ACFLWY_05250 [Chloroflexota bacterium]
MKVLKGKRLIDANGGAPIQNAVMVIEGQRIEEVGSEVEVSVPAGAEVIDMGDCILMPGLIDLVAMPIGMKEEFCKNRRVAAHEMPPQLEELYGLLNWQIGFENGVTTMLDARGSESGTDMYGVPQTAVGVAIRDAINNGLFAGPRALVTGRASFTNSHLSRCNSYLWEPPDVLGDGPWELRKVV